jgi:hypothetical protein
LSGLMGSLMDEDGRPLDEPSAANAYTRSDVRRVACPHADRRRGLPMNATALRQAKSCWPELMVFLRQGAPTVEGAWHTTLAAMLAGPRVGEPIPRGLAALYKVALGLNQVLLGVMLRGDGLAARPLGELADPEQFYRWLDREGLLLGQLEVCAGSPQQFRDVWSALLEPGPGYSEPDFATLQAAQLALMAATYQALKDGAPNDLGFVGPWLHQNRPFAWLDCPPDRQPDHVQRLFSEPRASFGFGGDHAENQSIFRALEASVLPHPGLALPPSGHM